MSALDRTDVEALARLARLELEAGEADRLAAELGAILDHMAALAAVDTDGIEPMTHAVPMTLALRADLLQPSLPIEDVLAGAPDHDGECFRVPAIIKPADGAATGDPDAPRGPRGPRG